MEIVALRAYISAVILPAVILIYKPKLFKIKPRHLWCFVGAGILSFLMFSWCYFYTIEQTSLSVAAVLLYSAPAMVTLMSALFFRERLTVIKVLACIISFAGCALVTGVFTGNAVIPLMGILTGLCSAFGYALYSIFGRAALLRNYHPLTMTVYTIIIASAGLLLLTDFKSIMTVAVKSPENGIYALLMSVITTVLPYTLYTTGLKNIESGTASVMASVEPVAAGIVGWAAFSEKPNGLGIAGIALVLAAIVLINVPIQIRVKKQAVKS